MAGKKGVSDAKKSDTQQPEPPKTDESIDTGQRKPFETLEEVKNAVQNDDSAGGKRGVKAGTKRGSYKKRGSKKTAPEPEPDAPFEFDKGALAEGFKAVFAVAAVRAGQHWLLKNEEAAMLATAFDGVIAKYAPMIGSYAPEVGAAIALGSILAPRIMANYAMAKLAKAEYERKVAENVTGLKTEDKDAAA